MGPLSNSGCFYRAISDGSCMLSNDVFGVAFRMGFDPECIVHPEQVPGEYYCPLCRQLVHPAEVQQTLCGHLFCRPCVLYIVATTRCCPYENHPINEGEPKVYSCSDRSNPSRVCALLVSPL